MRFRPTITFEQYRATCKAVAAAKSKAAGNRSWFGSVGLGVVCLALGLSLQIPAARIPALTALAVLALCSILSKPFAKRSQDRCFRTIFSEVQEALNDQGLLIEETGITCDRGNGLAVSHSAWKAFIKRIEMPDAYVFLPTPNSFIRVPKQKLALPEQELVMKWSSTIPASNP